MNDRIAVEIIDRGHEAILELLLGCDADVAQDGAGEFGKEALDEIEPGAVLGREGEFEAAAYSPANRMNPSQKIGFTESMT